MEHRDLLQRIKDEETAALGYHDGELSGERTQALEYYLQFPMGNEVEGESEVIDSTVRDTVEWMLPGLIRLFVSSGRIVDFEPVGPEDVASADQASDAVNHVFWKQNNGFLILYEWFKDAMISKNGVVKYYKEEKVSKKKEQYEGLTDAGMAMLVADDSVEVLAHTEYPAVDEQQAMLLLQAGQQVPMLHDVEIEVMNTQDKVCIEVLAPEEFLISASHTSILMQDCEFCEHRTRKTVSDLREMGFDDVDIEEIGSSEDSFAEISTEYLARRRYTEEQFPEDERDGPSKPVWLREVYIRHDANEDGINELLRCFVAGNRILSQEEVDHIPFAALTPNIMPHRWVGMSIADEVMDLQQIKTTLWRETLNNLYLTNRPRKKVLSRPDGSPYADLEDLLTSRVGGIVREYKENAVTELVTPFMAQHSYQMMEYLDQQRMNRTGEHYLASGLDADAINKTARGATMVENKMAEKKELIARIFAETGVKELMKGILMCLQKGAMRPLMMRLNNEFVEVDPRNWNEMWDATVSVGLGTGNKDQQLGHLMNIALAQEKLLLAGKANIVQDQNLFATAKAMTENAGYKQVEQFFTDPKKVPPMQPPPNPELIKIQAEMQKEQFKAQNDQMKTKAENEVEMAKKQIDAQTAVQVAQIHSITQIEIEKLRAASNAYLQDEKLDAESEWRMFDAGGKAVDRESELSDRKEERKKKYDEPKEKKEMDAKKEAAVKKAIESVQGASDKAAKQLQSEMEKIKNDMTSKLESITKTVEQVDKKVKEKPKKVSITGPTGKKYEADIE